MSSSEGKHVVFGANGGLGKAVVRQLAAQGKRVRAVTRSEQAEEVPFGVEVVRADATEREAARQASQGAEVIYHTVNVPYPQWPERLPPIMENLMEAAASTNARLVYGDNLYMYGKVDGALHEDLPYRPEGKKGRIRADLANRLLKAHQEGRVKATIGRASDFLGPGATNTLTGELVIKPALQGKKAMWIGSLDAPHSLSYTDDVARGLIVLGQHDQALGEVWHIPAGEPVTGRQFIEMVFAEVGKPANYGVYNRFMMTLVGIFSPNVREVLENLYQFERPFILDGSKYQQAFGPFEPTPLRTAIHETVHWFRTHLG